MEETALAGQMLYGETVPVKQEVNTNNYLWVDLDKFDRTVYHTEWLSLMVAVVGCFLFVHREAVHVTDRLDSHVTSINNRCDDLHKEFYDLLKEMKRDRENDR